MRFHNVSYSFPLFSGIFQSDSSASCNQVFSFARAFEKFYAENSSSATVFTCMGLHDRSVYESNCTRSGPDESDVRCTEIDNKIENHGALARTRNSPRGAINIRVSTLIDGDLSQDIYCLFQMRLILDPLRTGEGK